MSWTERIREAAYTSPSGERIIFTYENVSRTFEKRTAAFEFPDADGTYIQDLGTSGRKYPLRVYFTGADCDLEADAFEKALAERGVGVLEHPFYGRADVVPFGAIARRDDLKTAANQSIVDVTFFNTLGAVYPAAQGDPASAAERAVSDAGVDTAEEFAEALTGDTTAEEVRARGVLDTLRGVTDSVLGKIAAATAEIKNRFDAINASLQKDIDTFIGNPVAIAGQIVALIQLPARAAASVEARLDGYKNLIDGLIGRNIKTSNDFRTADLYVLNYVTASVSSVLNAQFTTKTEALTAAAQILETFDEVTEWRDGQFLNFNELDTGSAYQSTQSAVALATGFLVFISFSLQQEKRVVLTEARTIVDLVAELYGTVDSKLDFFISSNNLSGDEIIELPAGREIVYYV